ncbi:3-oxoacid CoA-transferase subunit B [Papillibacter cinnamivorans]|uniref:Acetate CoA/acetoacetate CoA-transferase beta subunit n=1 Tax=Papillibacter cinnamivorans DSM 12816 TaxID=1122930 RepID=A0A1W1ZKH4_9FIRM|nr:3-oxoacid CoA-transferase subunit B [Papillibacter cinnamivorans]SMC48884.1 acetate CoA/acetoacetate CoA-transferase beta subunit [Papillibacter cinnamivorans DSM 12816]
MDARERIIRRAALELQDGEVVNLGFGMPVGVANCIPAEKNIVFQTENGALMFGPTPGWGDDDSDTANAASQPITLLPGASIFDIATSFAIIRGGHVDATILGALEVDQEGNIANWAIPFEEGKYLPGMGGAMDLVGGARKVIAVLQHCDKQGSSKVLRACTLPITGKGVVDTIITERAVFRVTPRGLLLEELSEDMTVEELQKITDADFEVDGRVPGRYRIDC